MKIVDLFDKLRSYKSLTTGIVPEFTIRIASLMYCLEEPFVPRPVIRSPETTEALGLRIIYWACVPAAILFRLSFGLPVLFLNRVYKVTVSSSNEDVI